MARTRRVVLALAALVVVLLVVPTALAKGVTARQSVGYPPGAPEAGAGGGVCGPGFDAGPFHSHTCLEILTSRHVVMVDLACVVDP